jgi:phosphoribosylformylglycinamidine synthase
VARVIVDVTLKPEILDPQGQAVVRALLGQGLNQVADVRQGKSFEIKINGVADEKVINQIEKLAAEVLSNPVIENFSIRLIEENN